MMCVLTACALMLASITPFAQAAEAQSDSIISMDDLEWEWVDLLAVEPCDEGLMPLANIHIDRSISKTSIGYVSSFISFNANDEVAFNCSYSPSSASLDFGVIASSGKFYSVNVKGGSIQRSIIITQAGSYAVAIRNNSSQTVRVVGFVNY